MTYRQPCFFYHSIVCCVSRILDRDCLWMSLGTVLAFQAWVGLLGGSAAVILSVSVCHIVGCLVSSSLSYSSAAAAVGGLGGAVQLWFRHAMSVRLFKPRFHILCIGYALKGVCSWCECVVFNFVQLSRGLLHVYCIRPCCRRGTGCCRSRLSFSPVLWCGVLVFCEPSECASISSLVR